MTGGRGRVCPIEHTSPRRLPVPVVCNLEHRFARREFNMSTGCDHGTVMLAISIGLGISLSACPAQSSVEIEDECGGLPESTGNLFQPFGDRRGTDRSGLGLGLSIARKAVRAHKGDILVRNMPGKGCVFTIDVPLAAEAAGAPLFV
jgi:signal transduction histidine kinase